ncbi:hypothetical protein GOC13_07765 [Sinorhizobium meliloti]|nr:hypothetical protein [Sinorhizobium meliloti]
MGFLRLLFTRRKQTGISAKVVEDSKSFYFIDGKIVGGIRLTTFQLRYPRFIHAELMTHRVFSRNASSSRAIPVLTMLKEIIADPAMPVYWGANQKGMQAKAELAGWRRRLAIRAWRAARYPAVAAAYISYKIGLHKQIANRICEPWAYINVLVTATEYKNWFNLRRHEDAQPEIRELADRMFEAREMSKPARLRKGQWHLPYLQSWERDSLSTADALKVSVARCARVSYLTHDQKAPDLAQDIALYDRLVGSTPLHASPAEHQATPDDIDPKSLAKVTEQAFWTRSDLWKYAPSTFEHSHLHGNLRGFIQYRKTLPSEFVAG